MGNECLYHLLQGNNSTKCHNAHTVPLNISYHPLARQESRLVRQDSRIERQDSCLDRQDTHLTRSFKNCKYNGLIFLRDFNCLLQNKAIDARAN